MPTAISPPFGQDPPAQEFLVREQAIEDNLETSFTLFYFNATTD
jgi:hypothetical protein